MSSTLHVRVDDIINEIVPDACFMDIMYAAYNTMDLNLSGALASVIPSAGTVVAMRDFVGAVNGRFEMAYARMDSDSYMNWVCSLLSHRFFMLTCK